jgi:hypothetical protein
MHRRSALTALAFLGAASLIVSPALACERHQNHQASIAATAPVEAPAAQPLAQPRSSTILVSPAAEAAMSVSETLGSEPVDMRCSRFRKLQQVLTQ